MRRNRSPSATSEPETSNKSEKSRRAQPSATDPNARKVNPKKAKSATESKAAASLDEMPEQTEQHKPKRLEPIVLITTPKPGSISTKPTAKPTSTPAERTRIGNAPSPDPIRTPTSPWKRRNLLKLSSSSEDDSDSPHISRHAPPKTPISTVSPKQHIPSKEYAACLSAEVDRLMRDEREKRTRPKGKERQNDSVQSLKGVPMGSHSHFDDTHTNVLQASSTRKVRSKATPKVTKQESESDSEPDSDSISEAGSDSSAITKIIKQEPDSNDDDDDDPYTRALQLHPRPSRTPIKPPSDVKESLKRPESFKTPAPRNLDRKGKRVSFSSPLISSSPVHSAADFPQEDLTSSPELPSAKRWRSTTSQGSERGDAIMISSDDFAEQEEERDEEFEALPQPALIAEKPKESLRRATFTPMVVKRGQSDSDDDGDDEESEVDTPTPAPRPTRRSIGISGIGGSGSSAAKGDNRQEVSSPLKTKMGDPQISQDDGQEEEEDVAFDFYDESELASEHDVETERESTPLSLPSSPPSLERAMKATDSRKRKQEELVTASVSPFSRPNAGPLSPGHPVQLAAAHIGQASILLQEATETMHLASERHFLLSAQNQLHQKELVGRFLGSFYPPLETKSVPPKADQNGETKIEVDKKMRRLYKKLRKEARKLLKVADDLQPVKVAKSPRPSERAADTNVSEDIQMTEEMTNDWKALTAKITLVIINLRTTIDVWSKIMEIGWRRVAYVQHKKVPVVGADGRVKKGMKKRAKQQYKIAKREGKVKKQERKEAERRLSGMNEVGMWGTGGVFSRERRASGED